MYMIHSCSWVLEKKVVVYRENMNKGSMNFRHRWKVSFKLRLLHSQIMIPLYPLDRKLGGPNAGTKWRRMKNSTPTGNHTLVIQYSFPLDYSLVIFHISLSCLHSCLRSCLYVYKCVVYVYLLISRGIIGLGGPFERHLIPKSMQRMIML
jgi:hypothetical protein